MLTYLAAVSPLHSSLDECQYETQNREAEQQVLQHARNPLKCLVVSLLGDSDWSVAQGPAEVAAGRTFF